MSCMFVSIQFHDKIVIDCARSWIFFVFCLMDTFHLLIYFGYPLSFVLSIDTLDLLN
jgi:hypothetical protein